MFGFFVKDRFTNAISVTEDANKLIRDHGRMIFQKGTHLYNHGFPFIRSDFAIAKLNRKITIQMAKLV